MRSRIVFCSAAAWALAAAVATGQVGSPRAPAPPVRVALIDLGYIVDHSNHFQQMAASWQHDIKAAEEKMEAEGDSGNQLLERVKDFAGSQEYTTMETAAYKERADFQRRWSRAYSDFEVRKAKMYYVIRTEAKDDARHYAAQHGASLVLHYDSTPVNPKDAKSVLRALNKAVFYQSGCDITPVIVQEMNRRVPATPIQAKAQGGAPASSAGTLPMIAPARTATSQPAPSHR